jgi:hypothetical protein
MENASRTITGTAPSSPKPSQPRAKRHQPKWIARVGDIVAILRKADCALNRTDVQLLFEVASRQAQKLMLDAGAAKRGKAFVIGPDKLARWVRDQAPAGWEEKYQERGARFRDWLTRTRQELIDHLPAMVRMEERDLKRIESGAFAALPAGVTVEPGDIRLRPKTPHEGLQMLSQLATAIAVDHAEYERRVSLPLAAPTFSEVVAKIQPQPEQGQREESYCGVA